MQLTVIAAIVAAIASVVFAMQNNVAVTVRALLWEFEGSLALVLLLSLAVGAFVMALLTTPAVLRRQWQAGRLKRRIATLEETCEDQRLRIIDLESQLPRSDPATEAAPYVGLKQLIVGTSGREPPSC